MNIMTKGPEALLRVSVSLLLLVHGIGRIVMDKVDEFAKFMRLKGFTFSTEMAWGITVIEIIACLLLLVNIWSRYIIPVLIALLAGGIAITHFPKWFAVSATSGGMEYNLLVIICLVSIYLLRNKNGSKY